MKIMKREWILHAQRLTNFYHVKYTDSHESEGYYRRDGETRDSTYTRGVETWVASKGYYWLNPMHSYWIRNVLQGYDEIKQVLTITNVYMWYHTRHDIVIETREEWYQTQEETQQMHKYE